MDITSRERQQRRRLAPAVIALSGALALGACGPEVTARTSSTTTQSPETPSEVSTSAVEVITTPEAKEYQVHDVIATEYWIGEGATKENGFISNAPSAWSSDAANDFGGIDSPDGRSFKPKHNTFYFALPAAEFDENGPQPGAYEAAPWDSSQLGQGESLFKGRWVKVTKGEKVAYAQWHDVGPCANEQPECLTDYDYVFGTDKPINNFGQKAGIDLSPDTGRTLGLDGSDLVTWQFFDADKVPDGPWKTYPAITNKTNW